MACIRATGNKPLRDSKSTEEHAPYADGVHPRNRQQATNLHSPTSSHALSVNSEHPCHKKHPPIQTANQPRQRALAYVTNILGIQTLKLSTTHRFFFISDLQIKRYVKTSLAITHVCIAGSSCLKTKAHDIGLW
jgi:hypothetical protein